MSHTKSQPDSFVATAPAAAPPLAASTPPLGALLDALAPAMMRLRSDLLQTADELAFCGASPTMKRAFGSLDGLFALLAELVGSLDDCPPSLRAFDVFVNKGLAALEQALEEDNTTTAVADAINAVVLPALASWESCHADLRAVADAMSDWRLAG